MKRLLPLFLFLLAIALVRCGEANADAEAPTRTNLLAAEFAPATYAHYLDSAQTSGEISAEDHDLTLAFIRRNARTIPAGHTLGSLHTAALGHQQMQEQAADVHVHKVNFTRDRNLYGFHASLVAANNSDAHLRRVRGRLQWINPEGQVVKISPRFTVAGDLAPGDSSAIVLLETAYERPTGNELNQPDRKAWRDTLEVMEKIAGSSRPDRFHFVMTDYELSNGLTSDQYWLLLPEERSAMAGETGERNKSIGLKEWCRQHEDWLSKLKAGLGEHYLQVTPILTDKGEGTHGPFLIFDRQRKVINFFTKYHKVPKRRINPGELGGNLAYFTEVDFWGWPMELRIYEQDID